MADIDIGVEITVDYRLAGFGATLDNVVSVVNVV